MKFVYTNQGTVGTYTLVDNPSYYKPDEISLETNERKVNAGLGFYNNGIYHVFTLSFSNIGTQDYHNLGTIHRTKAPITFFPMDEVRGTNESFSVTWTGNFSFYHTDSFWSSGYAGDIFLEQN